MSIFASVALCFIPLAAIYFCFLLLVPGFNKLHGLLACLFGLLSLIPVEALLILLSFVIPTTRTGPLLTLIRMIVINGIIEEGSKAAFLFLLPAKSKKQPAFFVYTILCGLALGCLETQIYFINGSRSVETRLFTAVVIHALCTALSGIFVYSVKQKNPQIITFLFAILFHGVYNYFASLTGSLHYFSYAVIAITALECKLRYQSVKIKNQNGDNNMFENNSFFGKLKGLFSKKEEVKKEEETQNIQPEEDKTLADEDATIAEDGVLEEDETLAESQEDATLADEAATTDSEEEGVSLADQEENRDLSPEEEKEVASFVEDMPKVVDLFEDDIEEPETVSEEEIAKAEEERLAAEDKESKESISQDSVKEDEEEKAEKKTAAKKTSTGSKTTAKKTSTAKKSTAKKATASAEKKTAAKKTSASAAKKTTAKKTTASAEKKTAAKKTSASAAKKTTAKKTSASAEKKTTAKKTSASAAKKSTAKKTSAKKSE